MVSSVAKIAPTILGVGTALPDHVVTNADLVARFDTTDEWIIRRTGIRERRWIRPTEKVSELAATACSAAVSDAGQDPAGIDQVIVATMTPDRVTPSLAPSVAARVGAQHAGVVDVNVACVGFLYALAHAAALVESGRASLVLVAGAEAMSRVINPSDRDTSVLFADGAGAVLIGRGPLGFGVGKFVFGYDDGLADALFANHDDGMLHMEGKEVYRHAVARMIAVTKELLTCNGLTIEDIDYFVPHQANARIVSSVADALGFSHDRVSFNLETTANTSAASIPLALAAAERGGHLWPGSLVAMVAFGAGFAWGAGACTWKPNGS
jgi:3-oxoacyl-[acyl-carrier-protein] synthase-3